MCEICDNHMAKIATELFNKEAETVRKTLEKIEPASSVEEMNSLIKDLRNVDSINSHLFIKRK